MAPAADHPPAAAEPGRAADRRAEHDRFVAFAFAGADMVLETDETGAITYAAGAFRSLFGRPAEAFLGQRLSTLVAPADQEALRSAFLLLVERGRLPPMLLRLADAARTPFAFAGIVLPATRGPRRLCLSLARPPAPLATVRHAGRGPHAFARLAEARLREQGKGDVGFLEVSGDSGVLLHAAEAIGQAIEHAAPDAVAREIAPGRFGLLCPAGADTAAVAPAVQAELGRQGISVTLQGHELPLADAELKPLQVVRALRHALSVFARDGGAGLAKAGFEQGLAGYVRRAGGQAVALRRAITSGQFSLAFQPIVDLAGRKGHHFEALIRPRPVAGCAFAEPQEFVLLVETLGLAEELDFAVAELACAAAARAGTPVAFNLSGQSAQSAEFAERLLAMLGRQPAGRSGLLIVEVTETAEIERVEPAQQLREALRGLEIPFCLDDFGAGAADIRLLRALRPEIVKLDGSYIPGVAAEGRERAFVAGMAEVIRAASAAIVAEQIETEAEAEALRLLGVEFGQGWLFGRPGPLPQAPTARGSASIAGGGHGGEVKVWQ
jgi:EAL domain-containing protein (putative c-di-GMP-specific phosphodiesterase class I)